MNLMFNSFNTFLELFEFNPPNPWISNFSQGFGGYSCRSEVASVCRIGGAPAWGLAPPPYILSTVRQSLSILRPDPGPGTSLVTEVGRDNFRPFSSISFGKFIERMLTLPFLLLVITKSCVSADERPNIIFVLTDDLGWSDVTWNNKAVNSTPFMASLIETGKASKLRNSYSTHRKGISIDFLGANAWNTRYIC